MIKKKKKYMSNIGYVSFFALKAALSRLMRLFDSGSGFALSSNGPHTQYRSTHNSGDA